MPEAVVNGVKLYYEVAGSGFPLIFCHEFAGSFRSWKQQVELFQDHFQVISYNARGYPPSEVPTDLAHYSQEISVHDLLGLLDHLGIDEAHIAGLSMGSYVALSFGLAFPKRARSLILAGIGTGSVAPNHFRRRVRIFAERLDQEGITALSDYPRGLERVQLLQKSPERWQEFHDQFMAQSSVGTAMILRAVLGGRPSLYEMERQLRACDLPALIMVGDEDDPCLEPSLFLKRAISRSGLVVFPRSGHTLNLEEPELFNRFVMEFLKRVERAGWERREGGAPSGSLVAG